MLAYAAAHAIMPRAVESSHACATRPGATGVVAQRAFLFGRTTMSYLRIVCAASVLLACTASASSGAENAKAVPNATLRAMGLGGVQAMSDQQGLAVRGKGSRVIVWGTAFGVKTGRHFAAGFGVVVSPGGAKAGGGAFGVAH
jgi:hypothetical protein